MDDYIANKRLLLNKLDTEEDILDDTSQKIDIGLALLRVRYYSTFSRVLFLSLYYACHD
jgi:hypothetical protein